jgi:hypothetical protein
MSSMVSPEDALVFADLLIPLRYAPQGKVADQR